MADILRCWKSFKGDASDLAVIRIGSEVFSMQDVSKEEAEKGLDAFKKWRVERLYEVQVCGPDCPRGYLDKRVEVVDIPFEELIFCEGECVGIYHEGLIILFDDLKTHSQEKFIGEFITGPDRTHVAYDYYYLKRN